MSTLRGQARDTAVKSTWTVKPSNDDEYAHAHADAASDVWAKDYKELADLLSDETVAPQKRIDSAIAWIKDSIQ